MKKFAIISLILAIISTPVMATSQLVTENNKDCDNTTLGTYDGAVNLSADWSANTINLTWYNDSDANEGQEIIVNQNSAQCTYNTGITLPEVPTKTGYTFAGWKVRCSLGMYYTEEEPPLDAQHYRWEPINGASGYAMSNIWPGVTNSGLTSGEWGVKFNTGELRGRGICTNVAPSNLDYVIYRKETEGLGAQQVFELLSGNILPYDTFDGNSTGEYCWCAGTDFESCHVTSPSWVFVGGNDLPGDCISTCSVACVEFVGSDMFFARRAIFGI